MPEFKSPTKQTELKRLVDGSTWASGSPSPTRYSSIPAFIGDDSADGAAVVDRNLPEVKCSVFETTANLLAVCTGSGMLSLPYTGRVMGSSAIVLVGIFCACAMYTFHLLAITIESLYSSKKAQLSHGSIAHIDEIDYLSLGKAALGKYGDKVVLASFGMEISLALVSFLINIGININIINPHLSISQGILIASVISALLSMLNLKLAAISSALGLSMTLLTVFAILLSGMQLDSLVQQPAAVYHTLIPTGVPVSLGLIAFCYGGHGVL
jgi:amino acid permease